MRTPFPTLLRITAALVPLSLLASPAAAQNDINPKSPNVLLLVDTSGSMELTSTGAGCPNNQPCYPTCTPNSPNTGTNDQNTKSRWTNLVEVLTGTVGSYSCFSEPRTGSAFTGEYDLGTTLPADLGYEDPFHRILSNRCTPGPGALPPLTSPYTYPTGAITYRPYDPGSNTVILNPGSPCTFTQSRDGLLDAYDGLIRFGLMTFDTHPDPGTGVDTSGTANYADGVKGTWSYFLNSTAGVGSCPNRGPNGECLGAPWDCGTPYAQEVGARNAAAPPWEGRMVAFGPSTEDGTTRNQWIQEILLTTRPYSATPVAGMLNDARDFLWNDQSTDPLNPGQKFGPIGDPLVNGSGGSCRQQYIILLTDGEPNLDLRPSCVNPNNASDKTCPFQTPEQITHDLANASDPTKLVRTFVVGFAIGNVTKTNTGPSTFVPDGGNNTIDCQTMDLNLCNPLPTDPALQACCTLNEIAFNGTPVALQGKQGQIDHALFPQGPSDLRAALAQIFAQFFKNVTGRTFPITAPSGANDPTGVGAEFDSGAKVQTAGVWQGVLQRERITCDSQTNQATVQTPIDPLKGDDFIANVNNDPTNRKLFTVVGAQDALITSLRHPTYSMRPYLDTTANDGVGNYSGTPTAFLAASDLPASVPPEAMNVNDSTCDTSTQDLNASQCRDRLLQWAVGLPTATPVSRCPQPGAADCSVIGDIFHSQPQVRVGHPSEFLRDSTYATFANFFAKRDTALYVSSNDGFFHSFLVSPGDPTNNTGRVVDHKFNNELWSFLPPAILPFYSTMYPGTQSTAMTRLPVLDGTPVLKDVGATTSTNFPATYPYRLERVRTAVSGQTDTWRTLMTQGFGPLTGGYFALDVTSPTIDKTDSTTGPRFLWQLTTDANGHSLFGKASGNPLITTVFVSVGNNDLREVSVAVLPGGDGDAPDSTTPACAAGSLMPVLNTGGPNTVFRSLVPCYSSAASIGARSLTFVRLDTGQILRTFRPTLPTSVVAPVIFDSSVLTVQDIPAPMVGQPVAYPPQTGQIADRVFVGDREGRIWRVDVSNTDTSKWTMQVFYDLFASATKSGQPIQTPPVLSVDTQGQITVAVSTGDQNTLNPDPPNANPATVNYIASITESAQPQSGGGIQYEAALNWKDSFTGGTRVTGPMTLFNRQLFYSVYAPATDASTNCADLGLSTVYQRDYITAGTPVVLEKDPSIVFGVGLRQLPACGTVTTGVSSTDAFLGYGKTTVTSTVNPGKFQIVIQRGGANNGTSGSSNQVPTVTMDLAPPRTQVRINSWAPIIE